MQRIDSLEKTLMLGKIEGKRRSRRQRMKWLDGITNSMNMSWTIKKAEHGRIDAFEHYGVGEDS